MIQSLHSKPVVNAAERACYTSVFAPTTPQFGHYILRLKSLKDTAEAIFYTATFSLISADSRPAVLKLKQKVTVEQGGHMPAKLPNHDNQLTDVPLFSPPQREGR